MFCVCTGNNLKLVEYLPVQTLKPYNEFDMCTYRLIVKSPLKSTCMREELLNGSKCLSLIQNFPLLLHCEYASIKGSYWPMQISGAGSHAIITYASSFETCISYNQNSLIQNAKEEVLSKSYACC